jgi:cellulose synthase/poly-beta-1,6-N-acetylglucosamine synthase-like glycosyltransferase
VLTGLFGLILKALTMIIFVNRYIAGIAVRLWRGSKWDETTDDYEPDAEVIIPMYNEGKGIAETLESLLAQTYPRSKLLITVVDDCSTDDSYEQALRVARRSGGRLRVLKNLRNMGKRRSINRAVRQSDAEIIVSVDSDVVVDADAIRQLIRRFVSPDIAAVGGRVDVRNKSANWLSRMQVVKYWYSYGFMKNLEWAFRRVMCLSGCLTAYRRSVLIELEPVIENRQILGVPIRYGEDRYLTRQIVKAGYYTTMTLDAVCRTNVPTNLGDYFSQQLRWRRSNIMDYAGGMSHVWRLNPIVAIHFFSLFGLLLLYPVLMVRTIMAGRLLSTIVVHIVFAAAFGLWYRWKTRKLPAEERVHPLSFLPIAIVLPVIYALMTPVAMFTLDSSSWETRGHAGDDAEGGDGDGDAVPISEEMEPAGAVSRAEHAAARAQLPAA